MTEVIIQLVPLLTLVAIFGGAFLIARAINRRSR